MATHRSHSIATCQWKQEGRQSRRQTTITMGFAHPWRFESENLRKRVQKAYELYNCGSEESFARTMRELKVWSHWNPAFWLVSCSPLLFLAWDSSWLWEWPGHTYHRCHSYPWQAQLVIFEYSRCFFTPYKLDDKRKNCNAKKHQTEDLMCLFSKSLCKSCGCGLRDVNSYEANGSSAKFEEEKIVTSQDHS